MPLVILDVVDDDGDLVRVIWIGTERTKSLLNEERQTLSRSGEDDGLATWYVKALAEEFSVAEDFDISAPELFDNKIALLARRISVTMSGNDTGLLKRLGNEF